MTQDRVTEERLREMLADAKHASAATWEGRHATGMPAFPLDFGVISLTTGKEVCRVWEMGDAAYLARLDPQTITSLITELLELRSEASRVPEGWKVVPVEPTSEMYGAGGVEQFKCDLADAPVRDTVGRVYAAMVAAAPASPDTQTQERGEL
jgi:hypothetical protein